MKDLIVVEYSNQRILTTRQIAEFYETDIHRINDNFSKNRDRYTLGKHYFALEGREKTDFLNQSEKEIGSKNAKVLYLWTEKGVLMHAKSVNTDKAWQVYEELVDTYFRVVKEVPRNETAEQIFTKDVQNRCIRNEKLLPTGYWCVVTEMWREAWTLEAFQKELKPSSLPDGSCGTKWRNHLKLTNHPLLSKSKREYLHVPNIQNRVKVWIYPNDLLFEFRKWIREEYAEYYITDYSPSRLVGAEQIEISKQKRLK
jgi:hypothetical protein